MISVIVPVYNTEKNLYRCINSILKQTYKNIEIIIINDGSTDNSGEICDILQKKDNRIKVIHKKNEGVSAARNAGMKKATGNYITFVDSDDWIVNDIYEHCIEIFNSEKCDVVDFDCIFTTKEQLEYQSEKEKSINVVEGTNEILRSYLFRGQTEKAPFTVWRKVYKRNLFNGIRFPEGKINEDIVTNYNVLKRCNKIVYTKKIGYFYFQENSSLTRGPLKKRDFDLLDASRELVTLTMNENNKDLIFLAEVKLGRSYFSLIAKIIFYGVQDSSINERELIKKLTKKLRKNFFILMKSPIQFNRKLMILALCINYRCLSIPVFLYKKIRR